VLGEQSVMGLVIAGTFFNTFFLSIIVFTFVLLVGNLIKLADLLINKGVEILSVLRLFLYLHSLHLKGHRMGLIMRLLRRVCLV